MDTQVKPKVAPLIAAIAIQLCFGVSYIWSVFQTGIANSIFSGDNAAAGLTFSLLLAMLSVGGMVGGKIVGRYSTRVAVIVGGIIVTVGFFLASLATTQMPWLLWVGYGLLGGLGMGISYSPCISCAQRWYPHKKGLVTGIIVSAIGFGGVVFTPVIESLINNFGGIGVGETSTLLVLSGIFLVVCTVGGLFMKDAPAGFGESETATKAVASEAIDKSYSPMQMLKTPQFYLATITFMLACMGGLMIIGFAKPIAVAKGLGETATIGVLLISMSNSVGRLVCGIICDKIGQQKTIIILLVGTAILSLLVNMVNGYLIYVLIGLIGFFYGGLLSSFPTLTAGLFGPKHMATNYGFVMIGFGAGAIISSQIAGYYKNVAANDISLMSPAFIIAACCAVVGIFLMILIGRRKSKA